MSSVLATISQSPEAPIRFLRQLPSADASLNTIYVTDASMSAFLEDSVVIGSGLNSVAQSDSSPAVTATQSSIFPTLLRDTGRKVTIVGTARGNIREVWVSAQRVSGAGSEGVPTTYSTTGAIWVRVFADVIADGNNIEWARIG